MNRPALAVRCASAAASFAAIAVLSGCAGGLAGTWKADRLPPVTPGGPNASGAVTFAGDGTYTTYLDYGAETVADYGAYTVQGDELRFETTEGVRRYTYELNGDELRMTEEAGFTGVYERFTK